MELTVIIEKKKKKKKKYIYIYIYYINLIFQIQ